MEKSFLYFKAANPQWEPDEDGQEYLNKVNQMQLDSSQYTPPPAQDQQAGPSHAVPGEKSVLRTSGGLSDSTFAGSAMLVSSVSSLSQSGHQQGGLMSALNKIYESNVGNLLH